MMTKLVDRLFQGRVLSTSAYLGLLGIMVVTLNITARNHRRTVLAAANSAAVTAHVAALHASAHALPRGPLPANPAEPGAQNAPETPASAPPVGTP